MAIPSFHGIFSSLGQEEAKAAAKAVPKVEAEEEATEVKPAGSSAAQTAAQVAVDIYEQNGYYIIRAPIAGVRLQDIEIEVDDKVVTIKGKREFTDQVDGDDYLLQECFVGEFVRSITLPISVDPKQVKATYSKDSILKILIPKREEKVKIVRVND